MEIKISKRCKEMLSDKRVNYILGEILGYVDYSYTSKLLDLPFISGDGEKAIIQVDETVVDEVRNNFVVAKDINSVIEYLLWCYLLVGKNL